MSKSIKLYNAITNIDESIISEAETYIRPKKAVWHYLAPAAACLVIVLTAAIGIKNIKNPPNTLLPWEKASQSEENPQTEDQILAANSSENSSQSEENPQTEAAILQTSENTPQQSENPKTETEQAPAVNWQTPEEILGSSGEIGNSMGLMIPTFVAYKGGFYGVISEESAGSDNIRYANDNDSEKVLFNEDFGYAPYIVENRPDCIALLIGSSFTIYQRQFDVTFEYKGETYGIVYPCVHFNNVTLGDALLQNEDLTLYSAVFYKGKEFEESQLVVDILPLLRSKGYEIFKDDYDENGEPIHYMDAWWVVMPINN